jgi:hypothetical protein
MNNPLIEEVRAARAARAESLDYDPHKIAEWARTAHAERQKMLESKIPDKARMAAAGKASDQVGLATAGASNL